MTGLASRVHRLRWMARRAGTLPMLLRGAVWLAGCAAFAVAFPGPILLGAGSLVLALLAAGPAVRPGGRWPTVVILLAVSGWLTGTTVYTERITLARLLLLAALIYLVHSLSALAAQVPYDAVVTPGVLARWLARTALVLLAGGALAVAVLAVPAYLGGGGYLAATVVGFVAMGLLAALLTRTARR